ncbi:hypothetical protein M409DRAFT_54408 [Zasmidium cellare ATCC 36951]|uniref:Uncharacterized protein n=1 Tax=Zasmidium cellare ATCC 36951 TaxID=1080233 RepID=A0A6A6CMS4_ZASCE|nr:uncharacterized protein M409DRAFT_54408 [Zasmidium cellare ATCC 36951]KAF2167222.1 hypothetical protein M409DRAFT_54408 [Zasmidium cellare ATCC 36951]
MNRPILMTAFHDFQSLGMFIAGSFHSPTRPQPDRAPEHYPRERPLVYFLAALSRYSEQNIDMTALCRSGYITAPGLLDSTTSPQIVSPSSLASSPSTRVPEPPPYYRRRRQNIGSAETSPYRPWVVPGPKDIPFEPTAVQEGQKRGHWTGRGSTSDLINFPETESDVEG